MSAEYTNNHYVPKWYQHRFIDPSAHNKELYYLQLEPAYFTVGAGNRRAYPQVKPTPLAKCFCQDDLYTVSLPKIDPHRIEKQFFGKIDAEGRAAVQYIEDFDHTTIDNDKLHALLDYLSTQKLRTPKGLDWVKEKFQADDDFTRLGLMLKHQRLFATTWSECIWQIANADKSTTKFLLTDHPVTVYNSRIGPRNPHWCRGANDPDIQLVGTHTIFPLSKDKVLILTNSTWAKNPYQKANSPRPNARHYGASVFNYLNIQINRDLDEAEVRQINFIMKSRAYRYVAAGKEEWLYPERHVSKSDWSKYGDGMLLLPDPRSLTHGGQYIFGWNDGSGAAIDSLGRSPGDPMYGDDETLRSAVNQLEQIKYDFAAKFGPTRRGVANEHARVEDNEDTESLHAYHMSLNHRKNHR